MRENLPLTWNRVVNARENFSQLMNPISGTMFELNPRTGPAQTVGAVGVEALAVGLAGPRLVCRGHAEQVVAVRPQLRQRDLGLRCLIGHETAVGGLKLEACLIPYFL